MELFSQRKGIKPVKNTIQIESMDEDLRNRLWDALTIFYWDKVSSQFISKFGMFCPEIKILLNRIWHSYYKQPIDTMNDRWHRTYDEIRTYFLNANGMKFMIL